MSAPTPCFTIHREASVRHKCDTALRGRLTKAAQYSATRPLQKERSVTDRPGKAPEDAHWRYERRCYQHLGDMRWSA